MRGTKHRRNAGNILAGGRLFSKVLFVWLGITIRRWVPTYLTNAWSRPLGKFGTKEWVHYFFEGYLEIDPLGDSQPKPLEILMVVGQKDYPNLQTAINSAENSIVNPISRIVIISEGKFPEVYSRADMVFYEDGQILSPEMKSLIATFPEKRQGWVRQQILKVVSALRICKLDVLVIDSDTSLLGRRVWLNDQGVQLLTSAEENHLPYMQQISRHQGISPQSSISFVCHHQVWQKDILKRIFPDENAVLNWVLAADTAESSGLSEYQTYGFWIAHNCKSRFTMASWSNFSQPHGVTYPRFTSLLGRGSVSYHSYLRKD